MDAVYLREDLKIAFESIVGSGDSWDDIDLDMTLTTEQLVSLLSEVSYGLCFFVTAEKLFILLRTFKTENIDYFVSSLQLTWGCFANTTLSIWYAGPTRPTPKRDSFSAPN